METLNAISPNLLLPALPPAIMQNCPMPALRRSFLLRHSVALFHVLTLLLPAFNQDGACHASTPILSYAETCLCLPQSDAWVRDMLLLTLRSDCGAPNK